jgi:hypothetical protein
MLIQLLDGRQVAKENIFFDDSNYSFKLGGTGEDVTTLIRAIDKQTFDGFDQTKYNDIVYVQHYQATHNGVMPANVGSTSTFGNFVHQLATDPLGAPLATLDSTVGELLGSSGFKTVLIVVAVGVGIWLALKLKE